MAYYINRTIDVIQEVWFSEISQTFGGSVLSNHLKESVLWIGTARQCVAYQRGLTSIQTLQTLIYTILYTVLVLKTPICRIPTPHT